MQYQRSQDGIRLGAGSIQTYKQRDQLQDGEYLYLQNVRGYLGNRLRSRSRLSDPIITTLGRVHSIRRLNDTTPAGPPSKYSLVIGAGTQIWNNSNGLVSGLSNNPISILPFRPNASVQPWAYCADSSLNAHIINPAFNCAGMVKVRSDGLTYKWGVAEPQGAPQVTTSSTTTTGSAPLQATAYPWSNVGGANSGFNYGHNAPGDGTPPLIIATPVYGATVTVTITGSATVNGVAHAPGDAGSTSSGFPGAFVPGASIVVGAFTTGTGAVVATGTVNIGGSATLTVPAGATRLQIGVNSNGNTFSANSGTFSASWSIQTSAISTQVVTLGDVTAYYWGDSPHSGPIGGYIWKNPNDTGSGTPRSIGNAAGSVTNNSWQFDSTPQDGTVPVQWTSLNQDGSIAGQITLFSPALESQGYQDFNVCVVGNLFIPAAGTYAFTFKNKDQIMVGIGGGATVAGGYKTGLNGQTMSVVNASPLVYVSVPNANGPAVTQTINITFPGPGAYPVEMDWDYFYHTGRVLNMTVNGQTIAPLPVQVRSNVSYAYKYRGSATGAQSNPSPASDPQSTPVLDNVITPLWSPDPQVDKVDYYRQDESLANYTYVGTGPNTNPPTSITDTLSDIAAAANPIMTFDDFEPFPSIDLPQAGICNVSGGVITWVSGGDVGGPSTGFKIRWLPGTIIQIGSPTQLAYSFIVRPSSTTSIFLPGVPDGTGLVYNISQPILANQPLPSVWGPTDNTAYMFGCYDPLRPGTLYFTKGNSPDSAPDTNQIEVTSPSEPLMNGVIVNGYSMVFSSERAWMCKPNFTTALATVQGVQGQPFNLQLSISDRGLYIRPAICVAGGKTVYFRAKDGIYASPGGNGSQSLTDSFLYNLFPHEGLTPQPITVAGFTIYPPDDSQPEFQRLSYSTGYLYYDYRNTQNRACTLVLDATAGWIVDVYDTPATCHALEEGPSANDTLVGCGDGTVRRFLDGQTETTFSVVVTGSVNFGDARGFERIGDIFMRAQARAGSPITVGLYTQLFATALAGYSPTSLAGNGTLAEYIVDWTSGFAKDANDIGAVFSWDSNADDNYIDLWSPSYLDLPENTQDRPTDYTILNGSSPAFVQGMALEFDTFGQNKTFSVEDENGVLHTPTPMPISSSVQTVRSFTFNPPFVARMVRIISNDGVPWRLFPSGDGIAKWYAQPYPESSTSWTTESFTYDLKGWIHAYQTNLAYISSQPVVCTMTTDQGVFTIIFPAGGSGVNPVKILVKWPRNKWKVSALSFSSSVAFPLWKDLTEHWIKQFDSHDAYLKVNPFGGSSSAAAEI